MEESGQELLGPIKSKETLKSFFETGDIPVQEQFADLIDAFRHINDGHTILNVTTAPNGIISIELSNGTTVAITPPVTDEYVPKTGGSFTGTISMPELDVQGNVDVNGDISGNMISKLLRHSGLYFSFNDTVYGDDPLHALFSTNDRDVTGIGLTMNSIHNIRLNIDSNGNSDTATFEIGADSTGVTGDTLFSVAENGDTRSSGAIFENNERVATQNWVNTQSDLKYVPKTGGGFTGNVGVGTDTPGALLEVKGTFSPTRPHLAINSVDDHVSLDLQHQGVSKGSLWYNAGIDTMALGKGISARHTFFIDSNDNFGIGTNNPQQKVHINGGVVRIQSPSGYGDIGSRNVDWFHFETDRPNFWFNKGVRSQGDLGLYNKETYMRLSDGAIFENNQRVATQSWANSQGFLKDATANNFVRKDKNENNAFFDDYLIFNYGSSSDVDAISFNPNTNGFYFNAARGKNKTHANANVYVNKVIAYNDIATAIHLRAGGDVYANGSAYYGKDKKLIDFADPSSGWLRFNPTNAFGSGIYCGTKKLRNDGQFEIGSGGSMFKVTPAGVVSTAGDIYEKGTRLVDKYLGKTAKALDSDKLDGIDSSGFVRDGIDDHRSWNNEYLIFTFNGADNVDAISYNDTENAFHFNADRTKTNTSSNAKVYAGSLYEGGTALSSKYLGKTAKAADSEKVDGINGASLLRSDANDTFTGTLSVGSTSTRQAGIYGIYDSTKIGHIWSMGTGYKISQTGANFGNLYGFAYKHTNNATGGTMAGNHQAVWCSDGTPKVALGDNIWTSGNVYANGTGYFGDGKQIIRFDDGWLRINPDNAFGAGIYCGTGVLRTDGQFEVGGSGSKFKVTSGGTVTLAGSITAGGNVTAYSDRKLKTAFQPIQESFLDKIDQLKPTFYQWKDKAKDQAKQLGFIAQDVKEVFPEWVHKNEEHYSMSYDKMGAVLAVQGIQELRTEIQSLKEELKSLRDGLTK